MELLAGLLMIFVSVPLATYAVSLPRKVETVPDVQPHLTIEILDPPG